MERRNLLAKFREAKRGEVTQGKNVGSGGERGRNQQGDTEGESEKTVDERTGALYTPRGKFSIGAWSEDIKEIQAKNGTF